LENRSHYDLRKFSFTNRKLLISVVNGDSVDLCKSRLGKFWTFQDVKYDCTVDLTGTRDRSEFDTENY